MARCKEWGMGVTWSERGWAGLGRAGQGDVWAADLVKTVVSFKMEPLGVSTERT